jgi:Ser-tRNA(Ala) deacylase AlaX
MTELLCMKDFDMESCEGVVVKVTKMEDGRDDIILDQTSFYPRGGGQDWDTGTITGETAVLNVEEVRLDESGDVHHIGRFEAGLLQAGDKVSGTVDHDRRAANMRLHSAELRGAIQKQANEFVKAGSVNTLRFMSVEEMHTVVRHVPNNIPKNKPGRVVMYGDFGVPCGGTHVKDISQVGEIHIPKLKEKKGIIRLSYTVPGIN